MTVTKDDYDGNTDFFRLSGTIAEVLQKAANIGVNSSNVLYYSDDNTDAVMVVCMTR